jgi:hypothetical protein
MAIGGDYRQHLDAPKRLGYGKVPDSAQSADLVLRWMSIHRLLRREAHPICPGLDAKS